MSAGGNDAHDGVTQPVETLGRAIAIATDNPQVTDIVLDSGRYTMARGETFPYTVPPNVVGISGPAEGGAVLVGTGGGPGLILSTPGQLQDLELDDFTVAVDFPQGSETGTARLKNLRIAGSAVALHAGPIATLRIDTLEIFGTTSCATGIALDRTVAVTITTLVTHDLGKVIDVDRSGGAEHTVDVTAATATSTLGTSCPGAVFDMARAAFTLRSSAIDGGDIGVTAAGSEVAIQGTTLSNLNRGISAIQVALQLTSSTLTHNGFGVEIMVTNDPGTLTMRGCTITDNGAGGEPGISLPSGVSADLGTMASPGGNVIAGSATGLYIAGTLDPRHPTSVTAVGNTWIPSVQGADDQGHYTTSTTIVGPILSGANFRLDDGFSLQL